MLSNDKAGASSRTSKTCILLLALLCQCAIAECKTTPVSSMKEIHSVLSQATPNALVIFDVDNTLYIPDDLILRPCGELFFRHLIYQISQTLPPERMRQLASIMISQRGVSLVDPSLPEQIKALQARQIKTMALTAMQTGSYGHISNMEDWRYEELKRFDIDFSEAFPEHHHIVFNSLNELGGVPVFKKGILASSRHSKGDVLVAFLRHIQWLPDKVIFIDDRLEFIESVSDEMEALGIDFEGFHFVAGHFENEELDEEVARLQVQHLVQQGKWLTDQEARRLLKK